MKYFLITVDTEGDNLWSWRNGDVITTENSLYIPRFQSLCEKYSFIPTYLTNFEMACDMRWVKFANQKIAENKCEVGMHIHAWNTPPYYEVKDLYGGNPYITEYPISIMNEKIENLSSLLRKSFDCDITSSRSGRWSTNNEYFNSLVRNGYLIDCSVTPSVDMSCNKGCSVDKGPDYSFSPKTAYEVLPGLIEIPMSTRKVRWNSTGSLRHKLKSLVFGETLWLRPFKISYKYLETLSNTILNEKETDYLEFMIHSSELMPGGSPYLKTSEDIEQLYNLMEWYFEYINSLGFKGYSLSSYGKRWKINNEDLT